MEEALAVIQEFDPLGVGAVDLRDCLMIQLRSCPSDNPHVRPIVDHHLDNLVNKNYKAICQDLKITMENIGEALKCIERLEPKPGRPFGGLQAQYITPDIYVRKIADEFIIEQNDDGLPKLRVSSYYKSILYKQGNAASKDDREYVQDKMRSALWLIRSIHQRQRTIYRVTKSIVKFQHDFFEKGISYLKPLILRDVAEDIEMHESTISRVTTNKYVHTPQGIFELKFFFNSGIQSRGGESVASESVKDKIQQIVKSENPKKPFSDQAIVKILKEKNGICIARRTVTKYREMMGVLSSTKRKKVF
jgi:RNA polymerase sigma-54 factor